MGLCQSNGPSGGLDGTHCAGRELTQDAEKVRQRRSRIAQRLNVPKRTPRRFARCGLAGSLFEHPAVSTFARYMITVPSLPASPFDGEHTPLQNLALARRAPTGHLARAA